jgi:hypothetical protein
MVTPTLKPSEIWWSMWPGVREIMLCRRGRVPCHRCAEAGVSSPSGVFPSSGGMPGDPPGAVVRRARGTRRPLPVQIPLVVISMAAGGGAQRWARPCRAPGPRVQLTAPSGSTLGQVE